MIVLFTTIMLSIQHVTDHATRKKVNGKAAIDRREISLSKLKARKSPKLLDDTFLCYSSYIAIVNAVKALEKKNLGNLSLKGALDDLFTAFKRECSATVTATGDCKNGIDAITDTPIFANLGVIETTCAITEPTDDLYTCYRTYDKLLKVIALLSIKRGQNTTLMGSPEDELDDFIEACETTVHTATCAKELDKIFVAGGLQKTDLTIIETNCKIEGPVDSESCYTAYEALIKAIETSNRNNMGTPKLKEKTIEQLFTEFKDECAATIYTEDCETELLKVIAGAPGENDLEGIQSKCAVTAPSPPGNSGIFTFKLSNNLLWASLVLIKVFLTS
jgi:hypothetical protein